jgi:E3 ubiquitin-protein ligase HERC2
VYNQLAESGESNGVKRDVVLSKLPMTACIATIGGFESRLRLGGSVIIHDSGKDSIHGLQQTGVLCRISPSGKLYVQDDFGVIKRCPITSLTPIEENPFNVNLMWDYGATMSSTMWIELMSFSVYKINVRKWIFGASPFCHSVNKKLLHVQQQLLLMLKATRKLFTCQSLLRRVLKGTYVPAQDEVENEKMQESQANSDEEDGPDVDESTSLNADRLLEKVLERATEPSPVKAIFSRGELEEAALALCQHLAGVARKLSSEPTTKEKSEVNVDLEGIPSELNKDSIRVTSFQQHAPQLSKSARTLGDSEIESPTHSLALLSKSGSNQLPPPSPTVQQLMEMGFSRKVVEHAIKAMSTDIFTPSPETLVAWLLENQELVSTPIDYSTRTQSSSADIEISESDSISEEFEDIDASGHDCCIQPEVFKKRSDFKNSDEYALYVQDHIAIGMTVRCILEYDDVLEGDIGKVVKIERDELHDLNVQVSVIV